MNEQLKNLQTGPIVLAGNWEPLIFRRRINQPNVDNLETLYQAEHTVDLVKDLKANGVNLLITHYFKGFGDTAEGPDMDMADKLIRLCHQEGIFVGGYFGDTAFLETIQIDEPEAVNWIQRDGDGRPIRFGHQNFRFKWCWNQPGYHQYIRKFLKRGIEAGLDLIHLDNFLNKPEPLVCRCDVCRKLFREHLRDKYSDAELIERFGHAELTFLEPPADSVPHYKSWNVEVLKFPDVQEWTDFKCASLARAYESIAGYCRNLNPNVAMECNPTGFWCENSPQVRSVDHARLLPHGEFFWDESPHAYGVLDDGAIRSNAPSMLLGASLNNRMFFYIQADSDPVSEMKMGEALAYNDGCLGMAGFLKGDKLDGAETRKKHAEFLYSKPELFHGTKPAASVVLYQNFHSLGYNAGSPYLQSLLCQQALLRNHVPYRLTWTLDDLDGDTILILPGTECLSDDEIDALNRFASRGGHLVLSGDAGLFDEWRRERANPVLTGETASENDGAVTRLPALELPEHAPDPDERVRWDDDFHVWDVRYWLRPRNDQTLIHTLLADKRLARKLLGDLPETTEVEVKISPTDDSILVHVIHLDPDSVGKPFQATLQLPGPVESLTLHHVDAVDGVDVSWRQTDEGVVWTVDAPKIYSLYKMTNKRGVI